MRLGRRPFLSDRLAGLVALAVLVACGASPQKEAAPVASMEAPRVRSLRPRVIATWPHDTEAFTQGLVFASGRLYESTGLYGRSELREVELETGRATTRRPLPPELFGEGLALGPGGFVQLTYREGVALRWTTTLQPTGRLHYAGEGWGLTYDAERRVFLMSDGSDRLTLRDSQTFAPLAVLAVHREGAPVANLNELEWTPRLAADPGAAQLWANVWMTDRIVEIDLASGAVLAEVDAGGLLTPDERSRADVLNGIAFDPRRRVFFVTGKFWPKLFEVVFE